MSNQGQGLLGHFYLRFVCCVLIEAEISGERLQDHWSSGFNVALKMLNKIASQLAHTEHESCLSLIAVMAIFTFCGHVRCYFRQ